MLAYMTVYIPLQTMHQVGIIVKCSWQTQQTRPMNVGKSDSYNCRIVVMLWLEYHLKV